MEPAKFATAQRVTRYEYGGDLSPPAVRGRLLRIFRGTEAKPAVAIEYTPWNGTGETIRTTDHELLNVTVEHFDGQGRLVESRIENLDGVVLRHSRFGYDASGRAAFAARKQEEQFVEDRSSYDPLGRRHTTTMTGAVVGGTPATTAARTAYDLDQRTIVSIAPHVVGQEGAAPREVTVHDRLWRPVETRLEAPAESQTILSRMRYDHFGHVAYTTDTVRNALVAARDDFGRVETVISSDGTREKTTWSEWNQPIDTEVAASTAGGGTKIFSRQHMIYTERGRLRAVNEEIQAGGAARQTRYGWNDVGGTRDVRTGPVAGLSTAILGDGVRLTRETRDSGGRVVKMETGIPDVFSFEKVFSRTTYGNFAGEIPRTVTTEEPLAGVSWSSTRDLDPLGRVIAIDDEGGFKSNVSYDEADNVTGSTPPGLPESTFTYDARGLPLVETVPVSQSAAATIQHQYDALGNEILYVDESGEPTKRFVDGLGRVFRTEYPDSTTEEIVYEDKTGLVLATKDRANLWLWLTYDSGGRVTEVRRDSPTGPLVVKNEYDEAGRLKRVTSDDGAIEYDELDQLGRPRVTRTYRYRNALSANPQLVDVHSQRHVWNAFDERVSWTMPAAGETPIAADDAGTGVAIRRVIEDRDGMGTLIRLADGSGNPLAEIDPRSLSRVNSIDRPVAGGSLFTSFDYWDGKPSAWSEGTKNLGGLPRSAVTERAGAVLGGSTNQWDASRRISRLEVPATGRGFAFDYDDRGRLENEVRLLPAKLLDSSVPIVQQHSEADERTARDAPQVLQASQAEVLGLAAYAIDRTSWIATHGAAHQIETRTETLEEVEEALESVYTWDGGRRTSDGQWSATYDVLGHLSALQQILAEDGAPGPRRVEYDRDPSGRIIGRRSGFIVDGQFQLEPDGVSLARDGLPANATFAWDPVADRLVAVFAAGASQTEAADANPLQGLFLQTLHGEQAFDDPLLITRLSPLASRLYPIRDQAGDGSIHAIADHSGNLVERVLYADGWGDAPRYLHGPMVDSIEARPGSGGSMQIRLRLTDPIDPSTIAAGALLEVHTSSGPQSVVPELESERTLLWSFDAAEWELLGSGGAADLSIVVTEALRSPVWGDLPVQEVEPWMTSLWGVKSTRAPPEDEVGIDRPLVGTWTLSYLGTLPADSDTALFNLTDLYVAGSAESHSRVLTGWKSSPFIDPLTNLVHLRNRDYDPATGYFWTPDPLGTRDSSNLYAFAQHDPINRHDPLGLLSAPNTEYLQSQQVTAGSRRAYRVRQEEAEREFYAVMANPYVASGLQVLGCLEMAGGFAALPTGAGAVFALHGADLCFSGSFGLATSTLQETLFVRAMTGGFEDAGFSPAAAAMTAILIDTGIGGPKGGVDDAARVREAMIAANRARSAALRAKYGSRIGQRIKNVDGVVYGLKPSSGDGRRWFRMNRSNRCTNPSNRGCLGGPITQSQLDEIARELESRDWRITHIGHWPELKEEYIPGIGGGVNGSVRFDLTASKGTRTLRVQTVDTLADGITPNSRELANVTRGRMLLRMKGENPHVLLIPKRR